MSYNPETKKTAVKLRRQGWLYGQISRELGIPKSTIHSWLNRLELSKDENRLIHERLSQVYKDKIENLAKINRSRTEIKNLEIRKKAITIVDSVTLSRSYGQLLCASLFWCEGGKDTRAGIQFINSDSAMIEVFLKLLRQNFSIDESKFRAIIHLHDYHNPKRQLEYWSVVTGIAKDQFYKPYQKPHTGKQKRTGYPGCISVRYLDSSIGKLLKLIYTEFSNSYRGVR